MTRDKGSGASFRKKKKQEKKS